MNKKKLSTLVVAVALGMSSMAASAQPRHQGGPQEHGPSHGHKASKGNGHQGVHHQRGPAVHPGYQPAQPQMHGGSGARPAHPHGMPPGQAKRMGAGPNHSWVKGGRVPQQYRSHQYVVNDWRGHGLKSPPRGYHWVQYGGDYLLVAIATGVISQLILSNY